MALGEGSARQRARPTPSASGADSRSVASRQPSTTSSLKAAALAIRTSIDRYMQGEDVPDEQRLRDVFENTVTPTPAWDRPMYAEIFSGGTRHESRRCRRERRVAYPARRPCRLTGTRSRRRMTYRTALLRQRDSHPAEVIRREVLARGRHGARRSTATGIFQARTERPARSLAGTPRGRPARSVFTVTTTFADLSIVPARCDVTGVAHARALASLKGTLPGCGAVRALLRSATASAILFKPNPRIEDHFDALGSFSAPRRR